MSAEELNHLALCGSLMIPAHRFATLVSSAFTASRFPRSTVITLEPEATWHWATNTASLV